MNNILTEVKCIAVFVYMPNCGVHQVIDWKLARH